jgi:cytochrome c biogenesis protein CcdA
MAVSIPPSLILHGRTEIKARALVLGEVSALSFCLLAILPATARNKSRKTGAGTESRSRDTKQVQAICFVWLVLLFGVSLFCSCCLLLLSAPALS